jgi:type IV pilus assembly protein PilA
MGDVKNLVQKGFTLVELMIVVAIIAVLAAIAIPNFVKFQARSKQSEARANLKAIFTAQKAFFQEQDRFSSLTGEVGFEPERNNRYAYYLDNGGPLEDRSGSTTANAATYTGINVDTFKYGVGAQPATMPSSPCNCTGGATGCAAPAVDEPPEAAFNAGAVGNIDADATLDIWTVSSGSRRFTASATCTADATNPAGEPMNDQNDVNL